MPLYQIVRKLDGSVYIITQFQEKFEAGWPCSQTDTTPETTCNSNLFSNLSHPGQPKLTTRASGQCVCESPCAAPPLRFCPLCRCPTTPCFSVATCAHTST